MKLHYVLCFRNPIPHQPFQFTSREFITYSTVRWRNLELWMETTYTRTCIECINWIHIVVSLVLVHYLFEFYLSCIFIYDWNDIWILSFVSLNWLKFVLWALWKRVFGKVWELIILFTICKYEAVLLILYIDICIF